MWSRSKIGEKTMGHQHRYKVTIKTGQIVGYCDNIAEFRKNYKGIWDIDLLNYEDNDIPKYLFYASFSFHGGDCYGNSSPCEDMAEVLEYFRHLSTEFSERHKADRCYCSVSRLPNHSRIIKNCRWKDFVPQLEALTGKHIDGSPIEKKQEYVQLSLF